LLFDLVCFYNVYVSYCVLQLGKNISDEEIYSYYKGLPLFGNLTELRLVWHHGIHDWGVVVKMLQNCPKLQALKIIKVCLSHQRIVTDFFLFFFVFKYFYKSYFVSNWQGFNSTTRENWKYPFHVPKCVLSCLTTCNILGYEAFEHDFQFATYILKNARLLQVMTIRHAKYSNPNPVPKPQYLEDLYSCPKISPACQLSIIWMFLAPICIPGVFVNFFICYYRIWWFEQHVICLLIKNKGSPILGALDIYVKHVLLSIFRNQIAWVEHIVAEMYYVLLHLWHWILDLFCKEILPRWLRYYVLRFIDQLIRSW